VFPQTICRIWPTFHLYRATLASSRIITVLPSSPQVQSVYSGSILGVLQNLHSDPAEQTLCIDSTTLDVNVAREVAANVTATGAKMIDAPVSGGYPFSVREKMHDLIDPKILFL